MDQRRGTFAARKAAPASWSEPGRERTAARKRVLCVLPRKLRVNPLQSLLASYELSVADTRTATLRTLRQEPHDLVVIYSPLGWADAAELCLSLRELDRHTPRVVYSTIPSSVERSEVASAGAAYVRRADDVHNLAATAAQLMMLAELRSIDAVGSRHLEDDLVRRLTRLGEAILPERAKRLKTHVQRLFANAGGSRANFERVWPSLYESALKRVRSEDNSSG
jgi:response regulator RpfG family c-di-GMP phosphodiesterase